MSNINDNFLGKHVTIQKPQGAGSEYFSYKKMHSIVLMAIADSRYRFVMVDIGQFGSQSDGGIWEQSHFNRRLQTGRLLQNIFVDKFYLLFTW